MNHPIASDYTNTLKFYGIAPTPLRCKILQAIYASTVEFTVAELLNLLQADKKKISRSYVTSILQLYKVRGLLVVASPANKNGHRGRSVTRYLLSGKHILAML